MKLIIAIIAQDKDKIVRKALLEKNVRMTRISSMGGFFKSKNQTVLIGAEDDEVDMIIDIFKKHCETGIVKQGDKEYELHDALFFVCPLEDKIKF